jgi:hypothetical protein
VYGRFLGILFKVTRYTKYRNDAAIVGPPTSGKFKRLFSLYWKIFNPNYDFLLPLFGSKILKKMLLQMISGLMQPEYFRHIGDLSCKKPLFICNTIFSILLNQIKAQKSLD